MSYFKKFTDFCAGVAAFVAALLFLRHYMDFKVPNEDPEAPGKLTQFLESSGTTDYSMILSLIILLALSIIVGIIFRKLPYICFAFSILPALYVAFMFEKDLLYEQEPLFLAATILHVIGNLAECVIRDNEDGKHRLFLASKISSLLGAAICFLISWLIKKPIPETEKTFNTLQKQLFIFAKDEDTAAITLLGFMLLGVFTIGLLLYNVYFVDAILSFVPFGYSLFILTFTKISFAPFVLFCIASTCLISNIMLATLENNLSRKEQAKQK